MKPVDRRERVSLAFQEVDAAEKRAADLMERLYPPGEAISWERGGHIQYGTVLRTQGNRGGRFYVRNDATSKEYWITFYDMNFAARMRA